MGTVRRSWILITILAAGACGSNTPAPPSPGPGNQTGQSITGRERIGWDQRADSLSELASFQYAIYVDGARSVVGDSSCSPSSGTNGYACSGRLPAMSNGSHTLELAAFVENGGGIIEGPRSPSISVSVSADTAPAAGWPDARIESTLDGVKLGVDKITDGLNRPTDAAVLPDGRLLVAERTGTVRVIVNGKLQDQAALVLASLDEALPPPRLSIAVDPDFARTAFVFIAHNVPSPDATVFRVSRYRELHGRLAERAVLFETPAPAGAAASAVIRFGPDGKLYLATSGDSTDGRLFRLNPDGTMPRDQAGTSPAVAGGIAEPRGLAWDTRSGLLWIADDDSGVAHVSGVTISAPPVRASVSGRGTLKAAVGQIAIYTSDVIAPLRNEALLASPDGFIIRLHFGDEDPTRIAHAGRLLENLVGPIHVVTPAPDGTIYFCTEDALGKLSVVH